MSLKITLIGAGSVVFAKNLISDILQFPELSDATICLMDIDPARLRVAESMTRRIISALKVNARVIATLNQRAAIKDAHYVICTVQVGGYKPGTVIDFEIPRKYGLLQTIGDTLGVGGVFRGLRTIPVINSIARDIDEVGAPGCLLLNYSNPMAMNCSAIARAVGIPHVGLCHSVQGTSRQLAAYAGLPYEDVTYLVAGINHMAFFLRFEYKRQDAYPLLFELLNQPDFKHDRVRFEMMRRSGYFVTESSEHQSEYVPYFIHHGRKVIEEFEVPIDEYLRRCEAIIDTWERTEADLLGRDGTITVSPQSHEYGSYIIHSSVTNTPRVIYGNVPNAGLIDNLPREACVELPCLVDGQGIQPTHIGKLPAQLAALCLTNINVQTLTVEAAITRKREAIYHAVMLDPHAASVLTLDKIWAMCDELIAAHQKHGLLGEFTGTIPSTGRAHIGTADRIIARPEAVAAGKNGTLEAEIVLTNPRAKPYMAEFDVECIDLEQALPSVPTPTKIRLSIPAGRTIRKNVCLQRPKTQPAGFAVRLSSSSPDLLVRDYVVPRRRVLVAGSKEGASFELKLAAVPVVEGRIMLRNKSVGLRVMVGDSNISSAKNPWEGSVVEIYFTDTRRPVIHRIFIVPQKGASRVKVLDRKLNPIRGIRTRIRSQTKDTGYEIEVNIPLAAVGLTQSAESFLFDILVRIAALGDAHSGGNTSLSGGFDSQLNSSCFVLVRKS